MAVVGRNQSCPCGSGRKYKRCCADVSEGKKPEIPSRLAFYNDLREKTERMIHEVFDQLGVNPRAILAATWAALTAAAGNMAYVARTTVTPMACRKGCSWCCHTQVHAHPQEALLVAEWLQANLSPTRFDRVLARLRSHVSSMGGKTAVERLPMRQACPLLEEGRCIVYAVRPGRCVSWNSIDEASCQDCYRGTADGTPVIPEANEGGSVIQSTAAAVISQRAAVDTDSAHFVEALLIALDNPSAADDWLAGRPVFEPSQIKGKEATEFLREMRARGDAVKQRAQELREGVLPVLDVTTAENPTPQRKPSLPASASGTSRSHGPPAVDVEAHKVGCPRRD